MENKKMFKHTFKLIFSFLFMLINDIHQRMVVLKKFSFSDHFELNVSVVFGRIYYYFFLFNLINKSKGIDKSKDKEKKCVCVCVFKS